MNKQASVVQTLIILIPAVLGAWMALILPRYGVLGFGVLTAALLGFSFIAFAKLGEKKRLNKVIQWGYKMMTLKERIFYFIGYLFVIGALVVAIAVSVMEK